MSAHRFSMVSCSQCGQDQGPGDAGFSHCSAHSPKPEGTPLTPTTHARAVKVMADVLCMAKETVASQIKPEATLAGDLGCDSLDICEIQLGLEDEFDIEISDDTRAAWTTVRDVFNTLESSGVTA